jgi:hypothetical protein
VAPAFPRIILLEEHAIRAEARQRKNPDARYHHKSGEGIFRLRAVFAQAGGGLHIGVWRS